MARDTGTIRVGNGHEFIAEVSKTSSANARPVDAEGLALTGFFADAEHGAAISGTSAPLVACTEPGSENIYIRTETAAVCDPLLATRVGLWEVVVGNNLRRARWLMKIGAGQV